MFSHRIRLVGSLLLMLACASAAAAQEHTAQLRVVHAAPDSKAIDVFLDGKPISTNGTFRSISDYVPVPAGKYQLAVAPAGEGVGSAMITLAVTLDAGQAYTVAAVGFQNVTAQIFTDDLTPPPAGTVRVRVIHAVPDAPAADVQVAGGPTLIENLAFPNASKYIEVPPGSYNLQVVALGDTNAFLHLPDTKLESDTIYDVVAVGRLANIGVAVAAVVPEASQPVQPAQGQQTIPQTGTQQPYLLVLVLISLGLLAGGALLRRRSAADGGVSSHS